MSGLMAPSIAPVEYAVAVDRYLAEAELGVPSRRVYRVSLAGWAWPLVCRPRPQGASRRLAAPPVVPLAVLDREDAADTLAQAVATRLQQAEVRTVNRELSALRSAIGWWRRQQWIAADPTVGLTGSKGRLTPARPLTGRRRGPCSGLGRGCASTRFGICCATAARAPRLCSRWTRIRWTCATDVLAWPAVRAWSSGAPRPASCLAGCSRGVGTDRFSAPTGARPQARGLSIFVR